jgi:hypothetical protein
MRVMVLALETRGLGEVLGLYLVKSTNFYELLEIIANCGQRELSLFLPRCLVLGGGTNVLSNAAFLPVVLAVMNSVLNRRTAGELQVNAFIRIARGGSVSLIFFPSFSFLTYPLAGRSVRFRRVLDSKTAVGTQQSDLTLRLSLPSPLPAMRRSRWRTDTSLFIDCGTRPRALLLVQSCE